MPAFKFLRVCDLADRVQSPVGCKDIPEFKLNEDNELVFTGKYRDIQGEIDSHKDAVLLEKIIARCAVTGETLSATPEYFGDTRLMPKSILDAHNQGQKVQSFVDGLSDQDLSDLNKLGFDAFLKAKIDAAAQAKADVAKDGDSNE